MSLFNCAGMCRSGTKTDLEVFIEIVIEETKKEPAETDSKREDFGNYVH